MSSLDAQFPSPFCAISKACSNFSIAPDDLRLARVRWRIGLTRKLFLIPSRLSRRQKGLKSASKRDGRPLRSPAPIRSPRDRHCNRCSDLQQENVAKMSRAASEIPQWRFRWTLAVDYGIYFW